MIKGIPEILFKLHEKAGIKVYPLTTYLCVYITPIVCLSLLKCSPFPGYGPMFIALSVAIPSAYMGYLGMKILLRKKRIEEELPFVALIIVNSRDPVKALYSLRESSLKGMREEVRRWERWRALKGLDPLSAALYEASKGISQRYERFIRRLKELTETSGNTRELLELAFSELKEKAIQFDTIFDDAFSLLQTLMFLVPSLAIPLSIFTTGGQELILLGMAIPLISTVMLSCLGWLFRLGISNLGEERKALYLLSLALPLSLIMNRAGLTPYVSIGLSLLIASVPPSILAYRHITDVRGAIEGFLDFIAEAVEYALMTGSDIPSATSHLAKRRSKGIRGTFKRIMRHVAGRSLLERYEGDLKARFLRYSLEALRLASEHSRDPQMMSFFVRELKELYALQREINRKGKGLMLMSFLMNAIFASIMVISIELGLKPITSMLGSTQMQVAQGLTLIESPDLDMIRALTYSSTLIISLVFSMTSGILKDGSLTAGLVYMPFFIATTAGIILLGDSGFMEVWMWRKSI